ncbi:hypothetical protein D9757_011118 [Collybiopsis confluens]|uniref:Poly(A) RNA polymerase mitochondrial-like central palm domain-containing protein n=1 Tax=Collybiopsis confluens TaxID=2823264 RepID=A0A8H5LWN6_9AGAR|nr:hypothetical protein D9757_011118 [Collybiopsis confluens]
MEADTFSSTALVAGPSNPKSKSKPPSKSKPTSKHTTPIPTPTPARHSTNSKSRNKPKSSANNDSNGGSNNNNNNNSGNKKKRKRSQAETTSTSTSLPSSSASTPKPLRNDGDEGGGGNVNGEGVVVGDARDKERKPKRRKKKSGKGKEKERRSVEGEKSDGGGGGPVSGINTTSSSFDDAADFVALLDDSDEGEDDHGGAQVEEERERRKNQKGKEQEDDSRDYGSRRKRARYRSRSRSRSRERDRKGRDRTPEREWDRGKRRDSDRSRRRHEQPLSGGRNKKLPWLQGVDLLALHKEVEAFTNWISPSPVEDEIRGLLVDRIKSAVMSKFSDAQVFPFGSYATKLYLPTGDIDLVILSETMRVTDKHLVLRSLAEVIKRNGIANHVSIIAKARVPIVKFVTSIGHIPVDISVNQGNGTVGADVVNGFLRDMSTSLTFSSSTLPTSADTAISTTSRSGITTPSPSPTHKGSLALRALVLITKTFLSQRQMNEVYTGGLGSYSIVSLAISFLQMHPKIRRGEIEPDKNLGWNVFWEEEEGVGEESSGFGGGWGRNGGRGGGGFGGGGYVGMLSIEDPIDISNDISSGSYGFPKVRTTFAGAYHILTTTAYSKAGVLSARRDGRRRVRTGTRRRRSDSNAYSHSHSHSHYDSPSRSDRRRDSGHDRDRHRDRRAYDDDYDYEDEGAGDYDYDYEDEDDEEEIIEPEDMSILSHILVIGQDVINHRRVVQEVYDKRVLHDLMGVEPLPREVVDAPATAATVTTTAKSSGSGSSSGLGAEVNEASASDRRQKQSSSSSTTTTKGPKPNGDDRALNPHSNSSQRKSRKRDREELEEGEISTTTKSKSKSKSKSTPTPTPIIISSDSSDGEDGGVREVEVIEVVEEEEEEGKYGITARSSRDKAHANKNRNHNKNETGTGGLFLLPLPPPPPPPKRRRLGASAGAGVDAHTVFTVDSSDDTDDDDGSEDSLMREEDEYDLDFGFEDGFEFDDDGRGGGGRAGTQEGRAETKTNTSDIPEKRGGGERRRGPVRIRRPKLSDDNDAADTAHDGTRSRNEKDPPYTGTRKAVTAPVLSIVSARPLSDTGLVDASVSASASASTSDSVAASMPVPIPVSVSTSTLDPPADMAVSVPASVPTPTIMSGATAGVTTAAPIFTKGGPSTVASVGSGVGTDMSAEVGTVGRTALDPRRVNITADAGAGLEQDGTPILLEGSPEEVLTRETLLSSSEFPTVPVGVSSTEARGNVDSLESSFREANSRSDLKETQQETHPRDQLPGPLNDSRKPMGVQVTFKSEVEMAPVMVVPEDETLKKRVRNGNGNVKKRSYWLSKGIVACNNSLYGYVGFGPACVRKFKLLAFCSQTINYFLFAVHCRCQRARIRASTLPQNFQSFWLRTLSAVAGRRFIGNPMTSLKPAVPQVNLKERIAALQQKNAGQTQRPTSPTLTSSVPAGSGSYSAGQTGQTSNVAALREKIARFEKKGGVPVPRGSFGIGAPPPDSSQPKAASRELYGNRIPAPVKPQTTGNATAAIRPQYTGGSLMQQLTGPGPATSRSPSPGPSSFSPPSTPLEEPLKPTYTGRRGTDFSKAMDIARKAEAEKQQVYYDPHSREGSMSPPPMPSSSPPPPIIANRRFSVFMEDPPSIIVSPQLDMMDDSGPVFKTADPATNSEPERFDELQGLEVTVASLPVDRTPPLPVSLDGSEDDLVISDSTMSVDVLAVESKLSEDGTARVEKGEIDLPNEVDYAAVGTGASSMSKPASSASVSVVDKIAYPSPFTTQASPVSTDGVDAEADLQTQTVVMDSESSAPSSFPPTPLTGDGRRDSFLSSESTSVSIDFPSQRSSLMTTESPGHLTLAHRISPVTSRGVPMFIPGSGFPDTTTPPTSASVSSSVGTIGESTTVTDDATNDVFSSRDLPLPSIAVSPSFSLTEAAEVPQQSTHSSELGSLNKSLPAQPSDHFQTYQLESPKMSVSSEWSGAFSTDGLEFGTVVVDEEKEKKRPVPKMIHPRSVSASAAQESTPSFKIQPEPELDSDLEADFNPSFDSSVNLKREHNTIDSAVHDKTRDAPAASYLAATLPRAAGKINTNVHTPQKSRAPAALDEPLLSPGYGDLLLLVEQSAILEKSLMDGVLPDEDHFGKGLELELGLGLGLGLGTGAISAPARAESVQEKQRDKGRESEEKEGKLRELIRSRSSKSLRSKRGGSVSEDSGTAGGVGTGASSRRKPSFSLKNPLPLIGRSRSGSRREKEEEMASLGLGRRSVDREKDRTVEENRPKSMYLASTSQPALSTIPPVPALPRMPPSAAGKAVTAAYGRSDTLEDIPPTPPPKSPGAKYLSSFRRFASTGSSTALRSQHSGGANAAATHQRYSVSVSSSELSSEDSVVVLTPPDNSPGFGVAIGSGSGTASLREHSRTRSRSANSRSQTTSMFNVPWPSSGASSAESSPKKGQGSLGRATSFAERMFRGRKKSNGSVISSFETAEPLSIPENPDILPSSPSLHELVIPETSFDSLHAPPSTPPHPASRASWLSTTTNGSSLLFDKDMFDAFPSVPQNVPSPMTRAAIAATHSRESSYQGGEGQPSLDSIYGKMKLGKVAGTESTSTLGPHNIDGNWD